VSACRFFPRNDIDMHYVKHSVQQSESQAIWGGEPAQSTDKVPIGFVGTIAQSSAGTDPVISLLSNRKSTSQT
jgi:hypothetical protein